MVPRNGSPPQHPETPGNGRSLLGLLVALGVCFGVSAVGGLVTSTSVDTWYQTLHRPSWNPPGWVFGPVWAILYAMMAVAAWDVWRSPVPTHRALSIFAIQLTLNLGWSVVFFGLRNPGLALITITLLLASILATLLQFRRHRRRAALLLVPYLAWTSFAAVLNSTIWWMNRGV